MTTHELAKILLESPNVRVAIGRDLIPYQCGLTEMRVSLSDRILFNGDKWEPGEKREQIFWLAGPII